MMMTRLAIAIFTTAATMSMAQAQEGRWSGVYVGAHGAYSEATIHDKANPQASVQDSDAFQGGAQLGFGSQNGSFVFGVEGDVTFGKNKKEWLDRNSGGSQFSAYYGHDGIRTSGTVRARAGIGSDHALLYVTAGAAIADTTHGLGCRGSINPAAIGRCHGNGTGNFSVTETKTRFGYVAGGGVELAVNARVSIKGEYNYVDYGKKGVTLKDPLFPTATGKREFDISSHVAKVGVNFRF